jgi:hypothetical protein
MDTVLKTDRCFYCAKYTRRCYPIKYTDAGELPETLPAKRHRQNKLKEQIWEPRAPKATRLSRCHGCYVNCLRCIFTDPGACDACAKKNTTCRSIELNEAGELPETRYHRERRVARGESLTRRYRPTELQEQELLSISMSRMQILSMGKLKRELNEFTPSQEQTSQDLNSPPLEDLPKHWKKVEETWLHEGGWSDVFFRTPRAFDLLGRPLLNNQGGDMVDPDAFGNRGTQPYGPFGMVFDALKPVHVLRGSIVNHAPENLVPTCGFLNSLRCYYSPPLLPLVASLCQDPSREEMDRISKKMDHIYLIALQFPHTNKKRQELSTDVPRIDSINQQHKSGITAPEACLKIDRPWHMSMQWSAGTRYRIVKRLNTEKEKFVARLEASITELEAHFNQKLPRAHDDRGVVYLFHPANTPMQ